MANEFGARLRELRQRAGMSLRALAGLAGISFTYLSKIETGAMPPPNERIIQRLAAALSADRDELMALAGRIPPDIVALLKNRETIRRLRKQVPGTAERPRGSGILTRIIGGRRQKGLSRVLVPLVLVGAIAGSLFLSSPVNALDVQFPSLPASGVLGSAYSFTVQVDLANTEIAPISQIDMVIYNISNTSMNATCTALPLSTLTPRTYSDAETGGGAATVSINETRWAYGYGYRSFVWGGTTYPFGYGYGYGYGAGPPSVRYAVTWTPPAGWPAGSYRIDVRLTIAGSPFTRSSNQFTLSAATGGGTITVGGGGGTTGEFTSNVTVSSSDGRCVLAITQGTIGLLNGGSLTQMSILTKLYPAATPTGVEVIGQVYDLMPEGATFSPPATIKFFYDPLQLPTGFDPTRLVIARWDGSQWMTLPGISVDKANNAVTGKVSQSGAFALLAYMRPAAFTFRDLSIAPAAVDVDRTVTISLQVSNTGDLTGTYTLVLKINGAEAARQPVTLAGGASQKVMFNTSRAQAGTYSVVLEGLAGSFEVRPASIVTPTPTAAPTPTPTPTPSPWSGAARWLLIGGIIAGVVLIALIVWQIVRRRVF